MKTCCIAILALLCCLHCSAQDTTAVHGTDIPLCCGLDNPHYEYSGLARWENKIILIPQYPDRWGNALFALDSTNIDNAINHTGDSVAYTKITITNLDEIRKQMTGTYQGFEGAVVVGNTIFFTLEFSESTCYLLKGHMYESAHGVEIELQKPYPVEKPDNAYENAGYESISYLPHSKNLVVFFEKNAGRKEPSALFADTSFQKKPTPVAFNAPMFFRLTDVFATGRNTWIGINHYYNDYHRRKTEYNYYAGDSNAAQATKQMNGGSLTENNYTGIVQLTWTQQYITWQTKKFISFGEENWEGIVPFKKGFLMVVDEYPKNGTPRMRYFEW